MSGITREMIDRLAEQCRKPERVDYTPIFVGTPERFARMANCTVEEAKAIAAGGGVKFVEPIKL